MRILIFLTLLMFTTFAEAYTAPTYRDQKMATQAMIEKQSFTNAVAASLDYTKVGYAGNTSTAAVVLSSFVAQPDLPRNIVIHPTGTAADIASCDITVAGTNFFGNAISETFSTTLNVSSDMTGAKAFKTLTSVTFPANCEDSPFGVTYSIGIGEKIGLKRCMAEAGDWAWSSAAGVYSATRWTVANDVDEVEKNTVDIYETMDGIVDFVGYYVQNFRCLP